MSTKRVLTPDSNGDTISKRPRVEDSQTGSEIESDSLSDESDSDSSELDIDRDSTPAEAGWIQRLELHNFMCHDHFVIDLHPQINFIIGRNGAGKSAIMTGILVAFGVRANDTSRGSSHKDLIKHGRQTAKVRVTLANKGIQAYHPQIYGEAITVERKITQTGTQGYTLHDASGKVVSRKKRDLDEMLRQFSITAENPMAFLSQERAKQFLKDSSDKQKYDFFRKGASIDVIEDNYAKSGENLEGLYSKFKLGQEKYTMVDNQERVLMKEWRQFSEGSRLNKEMDKIQGKLLWHVVRSTQEKVDTLDAKASRIREDVESAQSELECMEQASSYRESRRAQLKDAVETATSDYDQKQAAANEAKAPVTMAHAIKKEQMDELRNVESAILRSKENIQKTQQKLDYEQHQLDASGNSREGLEKELALVEQELVAASSDLARATADMEKAAEASVDPELVQERNSAQEAVGNLTRMALTQSKDPYQAWGSNMSRLVRMINDDKSWRDKPLGPIGSYISLKKLPGYEDQNWRRTVCAVLKKWLNAFIVSNEHDRRKLDRYIGQTMQKYDRPVVMTRRFTTFDFSRGKAPGTTMADLLEVDDPIVQCALVDASKIEKAVLALSDDHSAPEMARHPRVDRVLVLRDNRGAKSLKSVNGTLKRDPLYFDDGLPRLKAHTTDVSLQLNEESQRLKDLQIQVAEQEATVKTRKNETRENRHKIQSRINTLTDRKFSIGERLAEDLRAQVDKLGVIIAQDKRKLDSQQRLLESLQESVADNSEIERAEAQFEELKRIYQQAKATVVQAENQLREFDTDIADSGNQKVELSKKIEEGNHQLAHLNEQLSIGRGKLEARVQQAEDYCSKEESGLRETDTKESLTAEFADLDRRREQLTQNFRRSQDECQKELLATQKEKRELNAQLDKLKEHHNLIAKNLSHRQNLYTQTLKRRIGSCRSAFRQFLGIRGYSGQLDFVEEKRELKIVVQRDNDSEAREVSTLSGGEKSFTQISFLLAIWRVMDSKVRGLDEFDVFMDSVIRTIAIKMLLQEFGNYPKQQHILVTPQDIAMVSDINLDRGDVKIHRMHDPR